jgi:hypothetical protein
MKQWTQRALITAIVLAFAGVLVYHADGRLLNRPTFEAHSINMSESNAESQAIMARTTAKVRIAHELIAGRLSLLQAAAAFRDLDERWPCAMNPAVFYRNAASEDEVYGLMVIGYVGTEAPPERAAALTGRLHAELDAMRGDGTLRLPDLKAASPSGAG